MEYINEGITMSLHDFNVAVELKQHKYPVASLIMAAMLEQLPGNWKLKFIFPEIWEELLKRSVSHDGTLKEERNECRCPYCDKEN